MINLINLNNPEQNIRSAWIQTKKDSLTKEYLESLEEQYELESSTSNAVIYTNVSKNLETDEIEYTYAEEYYVDGKLTDEAIALIAAGNVKPSLTLFKEQKLYGSEILNIEPEFTPTVDMGEYVTFIKPVLIKRVNAEFAKALDTVTDAYPMQEQQTWPLQEAEAKAYVADNTAATPMLDNIASLRGVDKDILVSKIIEKSNAFQTLTSKAIGYRQKLEDEINLVSSIEDVDTVVNDLEAAEQEFYSFLG